MDTGGGKFEYTAEEIKAIENAMKQKEFRELLVQYVEEISDPKNKEEYDQYLKQLEGSQELPKGMKLIHPTACFCIKTKLKNKKNPAFNQKLFLNICMTPELEKPTIEKSKNNKENAKGQQWHIPYSCGKLRMDQDKDKNVCQTVDVAFHPLTFEHVRKSEAFKKMICEISIEGATKQLKDPDEVISKDYKILTRMTCKGGKPAAMPVRLDGKPGDHNDLENRPKVERNEDYTPKLYQEFVKQQSEYKSTQNKGNEKKPQASGKVVELASHDFEPIKESPKDLEEEEEAKLKKIIAPKYSILHSYGVEYSDFLADGPDKGKKVPKQLVVKIEVPRVQKLKDLDLDINDRHLILKAANKYYLDISLPYKVNSDEGSAKFDSKAKTLTVTLPVVKEDNIEEVKPNNHVEEVEENKPEESEEADENSTLKFVTEESQKKYREEQEKMIQRIAETDKKLIEEIETPQAKEENKTAKGGKTVDREFGFMTQETYENYFFIFNVLSYNENGVRIALLEDEVLFSYEDQEREFRSWIKLLKSYNKKESQINFVKDYLVVNLKKTQNEFWESNGWKKLEYHEDFLKRLQEYEEQEKIEKEAREKENAAKEEKDQEGINHDEVQEKEEEEIVENKRPEPKKIEERYVEKRSINFINFRRDNLAFEID